MQFYSAHANQLQLQSVKMIFNEIWNLMVELSSLQEVRLAAFYDRQASYL